MATWLWVPKLDPKNDWLMLKSFSFGHQPTPFGGGALNITLQDASVSLDPGRFSMGFYNWFLKGESRNVYVFFDPMTEYTFLDSMVAALSTHQKDMSLSFNFLKVQVEYSGAP